MAETKFWLIVASGRIGMQKAETYEEACIAAREAAAREPDVVFTICEAISSIVKREFVTEIYKGKRAPVEEEL